jgi:hypothetical protein
MGGSCEHGNEPSGSIKDKLSSLATRTIRFTQEGQCSMELLRLIPPCT